MYEDRDFAMAETRRSLVRTGSDETVGTERWHPLSVEEEESINEMAAAMEELTLAKLAKLQANESITLTHK